MKLFLPKALKSHSKEKLETKKPYDFDGNKKKVRYQKKRTAEHRK